MVPRRRSAIESSAFLAASLINFKYSDAEILWPCWGQRPAYDMPQFQALLRRIFPRTHGTLFDLAVFAFAFLLPWLLQPLGEAIRALIASSKTAGGLLMLAAMLLQIPGALLKREALHERVGANFDLFSKALKSEATIGWLLFLYWLFMTFLALSAVTALTDWSAGPGMGTTLALATIVTAVVGYACWLPALKESLSAGRVDPDRTSDSSRARLSPGTAAINRERIADALLIVAALIVMYAIWQPLTDEITSGEGHIRREASGSLGGTIAYTIVLALPFAMFYIAPRLLFFVEDARDRGTWIRFGIIYLFAAYRMFFG